jgi:Flp pilus assembly protein TadG
VQRGQSAVEIALIAPVLMIVLVVGIQLAIVGRDALALGQMTYQATRWATSQSPGAQCSPDITNYMTSIASPTIKAIITSSGIACGDATKGVNVVITCPQDATQCVAGATRAYGTQVRFVVTLNVASDYFVPNPFLGVSLPQTLTTSQTAFTNS